MRLAASPNKALNPTWLDVRFSEVSRSDEAFWSLMLFAFFAAMTG